MNDLETNIFLITNLGELKSRYRLYRVRGLSADQEEYDPNIQTLVRKLSYSMRTPVAVIQQNGEPHLVLRDNASEPISPYPLVRATAIFEKTDQIFTLDYEHPTPETDLLRVRFLQFAIEGALFKNPSLWQPSSGNPYFDRTATMEKEGICVFRGYAVRVVRVAGGKLGVCIDVQHKYVSKYPLSGNLRREEFRKYKNSRCVYKYGNSWYEIKLQDHTGLSIAEQMLSDGTSKPTSLFQYIMENACKPLPREVADLPSTSGAVKYMTGRDEVRYAAAALCYPVFDTSDPRVKKMHRDTILAPTLRYQLIRSFVARHLSAVRLTDVNACISASPLAIPKQVFLPPDLAFGHGTVYSVRGTPGATYVSLEQLGQTRINALFSSKVGPYATKPLDRQYLVLPKSVWDSHGSAFLEDLKGVMDGLYPQELPYDPVIVTYEDQGAKTYVVQGRAILDAVDSELREPGFGIVMIHETVDRRNREHDQLAAMVMRELRDRNLFASVIHTSVTKKCYYLPPNAPTGTNYRPLQEKRGKLNGYLRNVCITKVLLTNERWPFVLNSPLHADLTVAIDVQLHTACFAFISKSGNDIRTVQKTSNQKEKLSKAQVRQTILEVLRQEIRSGKTIRTIVVQRDGRLFATELAGIKEAVELLKSEGSLAHEACVSFVEIKKRSAIPFRLFDVDVRPGGQQVVTNPQVGSFYIPDARNGYVCTTGRAFFHPGTTNPLHVRFVEGSTSFQEILEDVYALSCLAWTRPEDCTRYPVTIKLADIRLREHAGGYDEDALQYTDELETEEVEVNE